MRGRSATAVQGDSQRRGDRADEEEPQEEPQGFATVEKAVAGAVDNAGAALVALCFSAAGRAADKYEATWESITTHENPEWFRDAKFGIDFHWGPYPAPAFENEWCSTRMCRAETLKRFGREINFHRHHREYRGPQDTFGDKDLAKLFRAEKFDPEDWAEMFPHD